MSIENSLPWSSSNFFLPQRSGATYAVWGNDGCVIASIPDSGDATPEEIGDFIRVAANYHNKLVLILTEITNRGLTDQLQTAADNILEEITREQVFDTLGKNRIW
jgi:hypothetical protein